MKEKIEQLLINSQTKEAKALLFAQINNASNSEIDAELYSLLGSAYAIEGNQELALQYFNRAYELAPMNYNIILSISNFLMANEQKKEANEFLDRYFNATNGKTPVENIEVVEEEGGFDYMNFILGGGDALSYEYNQNEIERATLTKSKLQANVNSDGFSYSELILNDDINSVLEKYNLPIIEKKTRNAENTKPKILFTMYGWNEAGGGTAHPKALITELASRGYEVAVFYATAKHSINTTPYYMEKTIDDGVKLYGIYNRPTIFLDADNPMREVCDTRIVELFNSVLDEFNPNIISFHNFLGLSFEIASVAKCRGIVTTFTTHNFHLLDPKLYLLGKDLTIWKNTNLFENSDLPQRFPMLQDAYKTRIDKAKSIIINDIDYVFAVSNRVKEILSEFVDFPNITNNKICVINQIHNSIEQFFEKPQQIHSINDPMRFVFIGNGMPHKGSHIIAQAIQFVQNKNISFDFWGEFDVEYAKAIKSIDKSNMIDFRGKYSSRELRKIADSSDVLISASICEETGPIVLSEGLAMKLPVIASKIGGVDDFIIDGYNGCLFTAGSPKALASVIQMFVENIFKVNKMQENCNVPYSFSEYINHLENIYQRLAKGERPEAQEFNLQFREKLFDL